MIFKISNNYNKYNIFKHKYLKMLYKIEFSLIKNKLYKQIVLFIDFF